MKSIILILGSMLPTSYALAPDCFKKIPQNQEVVLATKRILLEDFPDAFNPSIIQNESGYLLVFRHVEDRDEEWQTSYVGIVALNEAFDPISPPQIIDTRLKGSKTPPQAEDARLFFYRGRTFLIFNDNIDVAAPGYWDRRDMFIAELFYRDRHFFLSVPLKLFCREKSHRTWEKNWVPFEWNHTLLLGYTIDPHEILYPNLLDGDAFPLYQTHASLDWEFGLLRGGTPALWVDGEYLSFFHSSLPAFTEYCWESDLWHYFMGAYTFADAPPFGIMKITPFPIVAEGFYTKSSCPKRVIFPGGFVVSGPLIYLTYGKDDREIWIATLSKEALMKSLRPVNSQD